MPPTLAPSRQLQKHGETQRKHQFKKALTQKKASRVLTSVLVGAAAAGDAAEEAEELVLELRGELGHGGLAAVRRTVEEGARCDDLARTDEMSSPEA